MLAHDTLKLSTKHFFIDSLPISWKNLTYKILIKFGVIKHYGHAVIRVYDKDGKCKAKGEGYNVIMDAGKGELGDLMLAAGTNTINVINVGTSSATPNDTTLTDLVAPATPVARQQIQTGGRFRTNLLLTFSVLVASGTYTRPVTIQEMAVYFDPLATGKIFARAVITAVILAVGDSARVDYEIQL